MLTTRMTSSVREVLRLAGLGMLLVAFGCDLGEAEVVSRSPDLGPAVSVVPGGDAAPSDADANESPRSDGSSFAKDTREAGGAGPDASIATDAAGALDVTRAEAAGGVGDGGCAGEAGGECGAEGTVFTDDFEDGAAGWMSTGITWQVTDDPASTTPNSVLAPTGPAASSVYFSSGAWQDMTVEIRVRVTSFGQASSANRAEIYARYQDAGHSYAISLRADAKLVLRRNSSSFGPIIGVAVAENEWHTLKIKVAGPQDNVAVEGYLDGTLLAAATDTDGSLPSAVGTVGVGVYGETMAVFDDVKVSSP